MSLIYTLRSVSTIAGIWLAVFVSSLPVLGTENASSTPESPDQASSSENPAEQAITETRNDIAQLRDNLTKTRGQVHKQRESLLDDISRLRDQVEKKRTRAQEQESRQEKLSREIETLQQDIQAARNLLSETDNIVLNARRELPSNLHIARAERLRPELQAMVEELPNAPDPDADVTAEAWDKFSVLAETCLRDSLGGTKTQGKAIGPEGHEREGTCMILGPVSYFVTGGAAASSGPTFTNEGAPLPSVYANIQEKQQEEIQNLVANDRGFVPVDPTGGKAVELAQTSKGLMQHLEQGRIIMIPLLLLGCACLFFAVHKFFSLLGVISRRADERIAAILEALQHDDSETARTQAQNLPRPLAAVIGEGIRHRNAPKDQLEEIMREQMLTQTPSLERFLSPLAVGASAAPLLGLLGTVTGMIHTFRLITVFGSGKAEVLSSGISEALVTTEVGLIIAVPALLLHAWFSRRVRRALALTRQSTVMFVNGVKHSPSTDKAFEGTVTEDKQRESE